MANVFNQDEWTNSFCLIYKKLQELKRLGRKGVFSDNIGIHQASLTQIAAGKRDFPLAQRQEAMNVLRDMYRVNLEFFQNRTKPMFVEGTAYGLPTDRKGASGLTYAEVLQYRRCMEENELLKKSLLDKDKVIDAQAALIQALQEKVK